MQLVLNKSIGDAGSEFDIRITFHSPEHKWTARGVLPQAGKLKGPAKIRGIECIDQICAQSGAKGNRMLIVGVVDGVLKIELPSLIAGEGLRRPGVKSLVDDNGWRYRRVPRVLVVVGETEPQIIAPVRRNYRTIVQHYSVSVTPVIDSLFR